MLIFQKLDSIYSCMYTVLQSTKILWLHTDSLHLTNHVTSKPTPPDRTCEDLNTYSYIVFRMRS